MNENYAMKKLLLILMLISASTRAMVKWTSVGVV